MLENLGTKKVKKLKLMLRIANANEARGAHGLCHCQESKPTQTWQVQAVAGQTCLGDGEGGKMKTDANYMTASADTQSGTQR